MLIYLGARATIQKGNNEKLEAVVKEIRNNVSSNADDVDVDGVGDVVTVVLSITGDSNDNAEERSEVTITVDTNTGVISSTFATNDTYSNFRVVPDIKVGTILSISPKDKGNLSVDDIFIVKVISINNKDEYIQVKNDVEDVTFNIYFESLSQLTLTVETQTHN